MKEQETPDAPGLRLLCPTRWTMCTLSLDSVLRNYNTLLPTLEKNQYHSQGVQVDNMHWWKNFPHFSVLGWHICYLELQRNCHVHYNLNRHQSCGIGICILQSAAKWWVMKHLITYTIKFSLKLRVMNLCSPECIKCPHDWMMELPVMSMHCQEITSDTHVLKW